jgi:hypothetical protein
LTKPAAEFARSAVGRDGYHTWCRLCKAKGVREWYAKNSKEIRAREKARYLADPSKDKAKSLRSYRKRVAEAPERFYLSRRNWKLLRYYGITVRDYEAMFDAQRGVCAICGEPPSKDRRHDLAVDHCHDTGTVRGLLCLRCNAGLGQFDDSPDLLRRASEYVDRAKAKRTA